VVDRRASASIVRCTSFTRWEGTAVWLARRERVELFSIDFRLTMNESPAAVPRGGDVKTAIMFEGGGGRGRNITLLKNKNKAIGIWALWSGERINMIDCRSNTID
jgi:hypothetical protein